jgi:hypothetical protein
MTCLDNKLSVSQPTVDSSTEAIGHLETAISEGKHWYIALLEAMAKWTVAEESHHGQRYRYLIAGEAFDFLLLAERLCEAVDWLLPSGDKLALLFRGRPPLELTEREFKELIGSSKYRQYLNYFYGVTVEEALLLAVQDEVRKERRAAGFNNEGDVANEAHRRIYGVSRGVLLNHFRQERGYPHLKSTSLGELKEFTYWLFKRRLKHSEKARIASDTKKALHWLAQQSLSRGPSISESPRATSTEIGQR